MDLHDRNEINSLIAQATLDDALTQYISFENVRKILAHHQVFLPRTFLNGPDGFVVIPVTRFGEKIGVTNDGEVQLNDTDTEFSLYFEWHQNENGSYLVFSEIVTDHELAEIMQDYHEEGDE